MSPSQGSPTSVRVRREPPRYRRVTLRRLEHLSPRMIRVTLTGPDLEGLIIDDAAASVRVLFPEPGVSDVVMPRWNGNEFLLPDGHRPKIRTFTPRRFEPGALDLNVDLVIHGRGVASDWAVGAVPGAAP